MSRKNIYQLIQEEGLDISAVRRAMEYTAKEHQKIWMLLKS